MKCNTFVRWFVILIWRVNRNTLAICNIIATDSLSELKNYFLTHWSMRNDGIIYNVDYDNSVTYKYNIYIKAVF